MICRNCSAEIDDSCETCPVCKKDPKQSQKSKLSLFSIIAIIICLALVCGCVYFGINLLHNKRENPSEPESTSQSLTDTSDAEPSEEDATLSSDATSETSSDFNESTSNSDSVSPDSPFSNKMINKVDINDQNGTKITTRAFVEVSKSEAENISEEDFVQFLNIYVKTSVYSWFTIKFDDNTGIVFNGNWIKTAAYGELDENGFIKNVYGRIILTESGKYIYLPTQNENLVTPEGVKPPSAAADNENNTQKQTAKKKKPTSVYVTASGTKYHKAGCAYLKKSKVKMTLAKAKKDGYTACSKCFN